MASWLDGKRISWLSGRRGFAYSIVNASPQTNVGGGDSPNANGDPNTGPHTVQQWFNTAAFALQPKFTAGNIGTGTMHGPPQRRLDVALSKSVHLTEKQSFAHPHRGLQRHEYGKFSAAGRKLWFNDFWQHLEHGQCNSAANAIRNQVYILEPGRQQASRSLKDRLASETLQQFINDSAICYGLTCLHFVSLLFVRKAFAAAANELVAVYGSRARYSNPHQWLRATRRFFSAAGLIKPVFLERSSGSIQYGTFR